MRGHNDGMADQGPRVPEPDEFDRLLRDLASGKAGPPRFTEPSAAERASQAAGLAGADHGDADATGGDPDSGGPGDRGERTGGVRTRATIRALLAAGVLALIAFALFSLRLGPQLTSDVPQPAPGAPAGSAAGTSTSPAAVPGQQTPAFTLADPFAGTPAEAYLAGSAGIAIPDARPVAGYSRSQVAAAYKQTRRLLIAANLDPATLRGGNPQAFSRLLTPAERSYFLRGLGRTGVWRDGTARSTRTWVTSFKPGTTEFVGTVIKVHGILSASTASDAGRPVLRIHFNVLFVYPVQQPGQPDSRLRIVSHVIGNADFALWGGASGPLQAWWRPGGGGTAGARCGTSDGFVHPAFPGGAPAAVLPSGTPVDPYDLNVSVAPGGCQAATGT
jgi:hypothetical protein